MGRNANQKLPRTATYVGGPMDQRTVDRPTNKFAGYKRDDGGRMGWKTVQKRWVEPLTAEARWPQTGYRLQLVSSRRRDATGIRAEYWWAGDFWTLAREDDAFWGEDEEWREADKILAQYPHVDPKTIDLAPLLAADALRLYESASDPDEPTDVHTRMVMADLLGLAEDDDLRGYHAKSECRMCQTQRDRGEDPFDLNAARLTLVLTAASEAA